MIVKEFVQMVESLKLNLKSTFRIRVYELIVTGPYITILLQRKYNNYGKIVSFCSLLNIMSSGLGMISLVVTMILSFLDG